MRIISGMGKGRNLLSPHGGTRPTSDRAREALFSTLESEFGSLADLYFLDLFCGSAAVATEALSRGAAVVHAVDNNEKATEIARQNLALLENIPGIGSSAVFTMSAGKYLDTNSNRATNNIQFDIVYFDPPYELPNGELEKLIRELNENALIKKSAVIAVERGSKSKPLDWPSGFKALKERNYGAATIYYAEYTGG